MANKMLIDATHPEETRVVVVRGNRVEEFDFEAANRRPLRGNIYLAKVTRVEPSLQACFVDYGGNRHGFLAFSEIHPDYYQIPMADRQALIAEEERAARAADSDHDRRGRRRRRGKAKAAQQEASLSEEAAQDASEGHAETEDADTPPAPEAEAAPAIMADAEAEAAAETETHAETNGEAAEPEAKAEPEATDDESEADENGQAAAEAATETDDENGDDENGERETERAEEEVVESVGAGDALEEIPERQPRRLRHYKIQEVIKRRQIMLVQVVKEERGTKGAAMTTYLSLAGRYSVLMPNTSRGGGISRKITDSADRSRLKELVADLEVPEGMGVILRTAGASRTKSEIKRDFEYLLRLWETVRELTLKSSAPALVYEEGSLTKRAIRDLYNKDIDEILVGGDEGYKEAKDFMRMLMPSHAKNVKPYKDSQPLFSRYGVESQLDAMFSPTVQLKSGGYIVINPTEALVAVDVNSGRSTREHHIEDTALRTNMEAAEEIARQLRLRDLAGLIVIDFIDMEQKRNNRSVERKLKDCLKHDRARIQLGRISHFGLMEMSRQRIRTGVLESSSIPCPHCGGTGHVRSVSSIALHLLRSLEEQLLKSAAHDLIVRTRSEVALYLLNQKRAHLRELEQRFGVNILVQADATLVGQQYFAIEKGAPSRGPVAVAPQRIAPDTIAPEADEDDEAGESEETGLPVAAQQPGEPRGRRRRRRGRGRGRDGQEQAPIQAHETAATQHEDEEDGEAETAGEAVAAAEHTGAEAEGEAGRRRRRRGRRGGRRSRRDRERIEAQPGEETGFPEPGMEMELQPDDTADEQPEPAMSDPFRSLTEPHPEPEQEPESSADETEETEVARRGSTVREPAPVIQFDEAAAVASESYERPAEEQPLAEDRSETQEESAPVPEQPRRTGWWQRR